jgi:hypothetical protein
LKEIGAFIGTTWTAPKASGLQSLIWRHYWNETCNFEFKDFLLTYNQEDCSAIELLIDTLCKINDRSDAVSDLASHNHPKRHATKTDNPIHHQLELILKFGQSDYDKRKISFRQMVANKDVDNETKSIKTQAPCK